MSSLLLENLSSEEIKKILNSGNPEEISKFLAEIQDASRKSYVPLGWNPTTTASYYKFKYAQRVLPYLNALLEGDKTTDILISHIELNVSKGTLRQMIEQGWRFIIDRHDPEGKFKLLRSQIKIAKDKAGVRLEWVVRTDKINKVPPKKDQFKWKEDLEEFVRIAKDGDVHEIRGKNLSDEDLDYIVDSFKGVIDENEKPIFHILKCKPTWVKIAKIKL